MDHRICNIWKYVSCLLLRFYVKLGCSSHSFWMLDGTIILLLELSIELACTKVTFLR